ncbi:MAG: response regulator [Parvibaculaceae bacterium]
MKVLLVEDHAVVREGVRRLLSAMPAVEILEAGSGQEALASFRRERPDVVVLDLNLPGMTGLEVLRRLKAEDDRASVVVLSMHAEPLYAQRALQGGARGYVSKSAPAEELVAAVERVAGGGRYVERELAIELSFQSAPQDDPLSQLTVRESDILRLLGEGKSLAGIAESLGVAYKTVANALSTIKQKLGVQRTADLIRLSIEMRRG